jgi:hypothetical protein
MLIIIFVKNLVSLCIQSVKMFATIRINVLGVCYRYESKSESCGADMCWQQLSRTFKMGLLYGYPYLMRLSDDKYGTLQRCIPSCVFWMKKRISSVPQPAGTAMVRLTRRKPNKYRLSWSIYRQYLVPCNCAYEGSTK